MSDQPIQPIQPPIQQTTPEQKKGKIEILSSIKKLIEKNGYNVSDEEIIKLFGIFNTNSASRVFTLNAQLEGTARQEEIKIFPKKSVYIEKYDEFVEFNDILFDNMINNFNNERLFKPYIDIEHQLGEKYADIITLTKKPDGLYATIELNEQGRLAIKGNKYSYISPEWGDRTDTEGIKHNDVLCAVTLTNIPALEGELPTLQTQIKLDKGEQMNEFDKRLAKLEGKLSGNKKLQDGAPAEPAIDINVVMEAIQMIKEAIAKIDELTQQGDAAAEEAMKFKKLLEDQQMATEQKEKDDFFELMINDGQLEPSEMDDWSKQYDISKEFVRKMLSSRPKKGNRQLSVSFAGSKTLSKDDYEIGEQNGYDMDDPKEQKRYQKEVLGNLKVYSSIRED